MIPVDNEQPKQMVPILGDIFTGKTFEENSKKSIEVICGYNGKCGKIFTVEYINYIGNCFDCNKIKIDYILKKDNSPKNLTLIFNKNGWKAVINKFLELETDYVLSESTKQDDKEIKIKNSTALRNDVYISLKRFHKKMNRECDDEHKTDIVLKNIVIYLIQCKKIIGKDEQNKDIFCDKKFIIKENDKHIGNCHECREAEKILNSKVPITEHQRVLSKVGITIVNPNAYKNTKTKLQISYSDGTQPPEGGVSISDLKKTVTLEKPKTLGQIIKEAQPQTVVTDENLSFIESIYKDYTIVKHDKREEYFFKCAFNHIKKVNANRFLPKSQKSDDSSESYSSVQQSWIDKKTKCKDCALSQNFKSTSQSFDTEYVELILADNNIELRSDYVSSNSLLELYCTICKYTYYEIWNNWYRTSRCQNCYKREANITGEKCAQYGKQFMLDVNNHPGKYLMISDYRQYKNNLTKFYIKCHKNHIFKTCQDNFVNRKRGCPMCRQSKLEAEIEQYLTNHNIKFIKEYVFPNRQCVNINNLRFDFYVEHEGKKFMIEADGEMHFEPVDYFGGEHYFTYMVKTDLKKSYYCTEIAKIPLLRIAHTDKDSVSALLDEFLQSTEIKIYFSSRNKYEIFIEKYNDNYDYYSMVEYNYLNETYNICKNKSYYIKDKDVTITDVLTNLLNIKNLKYININELNDEISLICKNCETPGAMNIYHIDYTYNCANCNYIQVTPVKPKPKKDRNVKQQVIKTTVKRKEKGDNKNDKGKEEMYPTFTNVYDPKPEMVIKKTDNYTDEEFATFIIKFKLEIEQEEREKEKLLEQQRETERLQKLKIEQEEYRKHKKAMNDFHALKRREKNRINNLKCSAEEKKKLLVEHKKFFMLKYREINKNINNSNIKTNYKNNRNRNNRNNKANNKK